MRYAGPDSDHMRVKVNAMVIPLAIARGHGVKVGLELGLELGLESRLG